MKKHINKIFAGILAVLLLTVALDVKLAQPEAGRTANDKFIGFFLAYEKMPPDISEIEANSEECVEDRTHWVEYGTEDTYVPGLGRVAFTNSILIGERVGDRFEFPGMVGYNCFLALFTDEDGEQHYSGYTDMADCNVHIQDGDTITHTLSGAVYFGRPLDLKPGDEHYVWTAYRVYQMEDGTVYLDGTGNSFGGAGGFSFTEKSEWTTTVNGESSTEALEVTVKIDSIPRLDTVTVKQYDAGDHLLHTNVITAHQAAVQNGETLKLLLDAAASYAIVEERDVDGNVARSIHDDADAENKNVYFVSWFLDEKGMGYSLPVCLARAPEEHRPDHEKYA